MAGSRKTVVRALCALVGVGLLVFGVVGLAVTGFADVEPSPEGVAPRTDEFGGGSTLLNIVHIAFGLLALLAAWRGGARLAGLLGIFAFLGLIAYDVTALIADDPDDPLGSRWPALLVHALCLAAAIAVVAIDESRDREPRASGSGGGTAPA